jgi:hypothetical protein
MSRKVVRLTVDAVPLSGTYEGSLPASPRVGESLGN